MRRFRIDKKISTVAPLIVLLAGAVAGCSGHSSSSGGNGGNNGNGGTPPPTVASLSPLGADAGSPALMLTVTGSQFVAGSVVKWGAETLTTTFVSASQLTAAVPSTDLAFAGSTAVSVSNPAPGGSSTALPFAVAARVANGSALSGAPGSAALAATVDMPPVGVASSFVHGGVIMNRLDVRFAADATVAQVNGALASIGGGIVSMSLGFPTVTIGIPEQTSTARLQALIDHLQASPGMLIATLAVLPTPLANFFGDLSNPATAEAVADEAQQLLSERFPAMWNLARIDVFGDPLQPQPALCAFATPVLVADFFATPVPADIKSEIPLLPPTDEPASDTDPDELTHGYDVAEVLAANRLGANPFPFSGCPDLRLVQLALNLSDDQLTDYIVAHMPTSERFVMNYSAGFKQVCDADDCLPPTDGLVTPDFYAEKALHWKEKTHDRWQDFLVVAGAGNDLDDESATIYPGLGDSRFESLYTIAQLPDTEFQFVVDDALWTPNAAFAAEGFKSLKSSPAQQTALLVAVENAGPAALREDNVIVVGSVSAQHANFSTLHVPAEVLAASEFSEHSPDVLAVGEFAFGNVGTSFAAPQVTGLISFLWMIDLSLRGTEPVAVTKRAVVENARNGVIDAYATALSLDQAALPTPQSAPQRTNLLNVNGFAGFTEGDVDLILGNLFVRDPGTGDITHQAAAGTVVDFSRFDLNGDGFTTAGARRERFDLDRAGSTQYGATLYSNVSQDIEDAEVQFDETALTDLEILCYYAYSALYTGDTDARSELLAGRCGLAVQPAKASLSPGQTQQFTALLPGNHAVVWTATCGTVDAAGHYTAGSDAGPCTVRATDATDPSVSGTAIVTILGTFVAEDGYHTTISASDPFNGADIFPSEDADASNTHKPNPTLGPIDLSHAGTYQAPNFEPVNYTITAHGGGPIEQPIAGSGTFNGSSGCSALGNTGTDNLGNPTSPAMPELESDSSGSMNVTVPPGGLGFSVTGSMTRSQSRGTGGLMDLTGLVTIKYSDAGGPLQTVHFELRESTGANVPFNFSRQLTAPASLAIAWRVIAHCLGGNGTSSGIDVARAGTVTLSYSLSN